MQSTDPHNANDYALEDDADELELCGHVALEVLEDEPLPVVADRDDMCDAVTDAGAVAAPAANVPRPTPSPVAADITPATMIAGFPLTFTCWSPLAHMVDRSIHQSIEDDARNRLLCAP